MSSLKWLHNKINDVALPERHTLPRLTRLSESTHARAIRHFRTLSEWMKVDESLKPKIFPYEGSEIIDPGDIEISGTASTRLKGGRG